MTISNTADEPTQIIQKQIIFSSKIKCKRFYTHRGEKKDGGRKCAEGVCSRKIIHIRNIYIFFR